MNDAADLLEDAADLLEAAEGHARAGELRHARTHFERAAAAAAANALRPVAIRSLAGLAWTLCRMGEPAESLACADRALAAPEADAAAAMLHGLRGNALMALDDPEAALAAYQTSYTARLAAGAGDGELAFALNLIGEAACRLDRLELASASQSGAVALLRAGRPQTDAALALTLSNLGVSLVRQDRAAEAEPALREAHDIDPALRPAVESLVHLLFKAGRKKEAIVLAEDAFRTSSFIVLPPPLDSQGCVLVLCAFDGTVPHDHLLDQLPAQRINWYLEFADASHERQLPPYDAVFNCVGDADAGPLAVARAMQFAAQCRARVLNDPANIARTRRHEVAARRDAIPGLVIPRVVQMSAPEAAGDAADMLAQHGLQFPVLVRNAGMHGGDTVVLAPDAAACAAALADIPADAQLYLAAYHDYAGPDGMFRKYRVIFIDRVPYPYHLAISPKWLVHYFSAEMLDHAWKLDEERRFLDDMETALGPIAMSVLREVGQRMDLDYCGIDFSLLPDGRVLFFECNATMLVHGEARDGPLAHKNVAVKKIVSALQGRILEAIASGPC